MKCYFQGCQNKGVTKEHIPPKSFFPKNQRNQLLTVKSCKTHNNDKAKNDIYVLAQICLNASPSNYSRDLFIEKVVPQLGYNNDALRKMLIAGSMTLKNGAVRYKVDSQRLDNFFDALSCGIIFKSAGDSLPPEYKLSHIYHNFEYSSETENERAIKQSILNFYNLEKPIDILEFGKVKTTNTRIYSAKIFGLANFVGSITIVHLFYGIFRVTSMLTKIHHC